MSPLCYSGRTNGTENFRVLQTGNTLFPRQSSVGNTYLYKGFKAMMSRIVLTISAVRAYKHKRDLIKKKTGKGQGLSINTMFPNPSTVGAQSICLQCCAEMVFSCWGSYFSWGARAAGWLPACTKLVLGQRYSQVDHSSHLGAKVQLKDNTQT